MKWVFRSLGVVAALVLVVVTVGFLLPVKHTASRTASFPVPPEKLWQVLTTIPEFPSWRKNLQKVEVLPNSDGHTRWRETETNGDATTFEIVAADAPKKIVTRIADTDLAFGGSWTYEISPSASGSQLTITEDGEVYNPIFRFVSRFIMGHHATIAAYLENLKTVAR